MVKCHDFQRKRRKNREIATPVCALARNDMLFFSAAANRVNNNLHYQSAVGIFGTPLIYPNQNGKIIKKFKE
jgi:hypothetical protein